MRRTTTAARIQTDASLLSIATPPPTPPKLLLPIYARARALLRATCNSEDSQIAGREEETAKIHGFIDSFLGSSKEVKEAPLALYISGSPGTGKTALVNTVLHTITAADVRVVNINCMALSNVDTLWDRLFEEIQQTTSKRKGTGRSKKLGVREALELLLSTTETRWLAHFLLYALQVSKLFILASSCLTNSTTLPLILRLSMLYSLYPQKFQQKFESLELRTHTR